MGDRTKKRTPDPLKRKIHLTSGEWSYETGSSGVRVRTPDCENTTFVGLDKLLGMDMEEAKKHPVKPQTIKEYIEANEKSLR